MTRAFKSAAVLCAAFALACACAGHARAGAPPPQARKARAARAKRKPAARPAPLPSVREIDAAGLKALLDKNRTDGRILLVNFWATWCGPCREEFPDLVRIQQEFGEDAGFHFITISLDDPSDIKAAVPEFLSKMRATRMPAYLLNEPEPEAAINLVDPDWRGELPATFLFGRRGEVSYKHKGRVKPDDLRKAVAAARERRYDDAPQPAPAPSPTPTPTPTPTPQY